MKKTCRRLSWSLWRHDRCLAGAGDIAHRGFAGWRSALWCSFLLWSLPVLQRWSSPLVASICSVWSSAWLCLGYWWGWSFGSSDTALGCLSWEVWWLRTGSTRLAILQSARSFCRVSWERWLHPLHLLGPVLLGCCRLQRTSLLQWLHCSLHFFAKDGIVILCDCLGTVQYWWISVGLVIVQLRAVFCPSVQCISFFCEALSWTILDNSSFPSFHMIRAQPKRYSTIRSRVQYPTGHKRNFVFSKPKRMCWLVVEVPSSLVYRYARTFKILQSLSVIGGLWKRINTACIIAWTYTYISRSKEQARQRVKSKTRQQSTREPKCSTTPAQLVTHRWRCCWAVWWECRRRRPRYPPLPGWRWGSWWRCACAECGWRRRWPLCCRWGRRGRWAGRPRSRRRSCKRAAWWAGSRWALQTGAHDRPWDWTCPLRTLPR